MNISGNFIENEICKERITKIKEKFCAYRHSDLILRGKYNKQ